VYVYVCDVVTVAMTRISSFLLAPELDSQPIRLPMDRALPAVSITAASFKWDADGSTKPAADAPPSSTESKPSAPPSESQPTTGEASTATQAAAQPSQAAVATLSNINISIPHGSLTAVIGAVGSGKSTLLAGMLGEVRRLEGNVTLCGKVGYCPQQAWIQNTTLRNNILFGLPFDEQRYAHAIRVSALSRDLAVLPDGDLSEIGEKGINLSGGQKQRVNIARAVYFNPDTILLDDPLSAVDSHVAAFLFSECINKAFADKTRYIFCGTLGVMDVCDVCVSVFVLCVGYECVCVCLCVVLLCLPIIFVVPLVRVVCHCPQGACDASAALLASARGVPHHCAQRRSGCGTGVL
jgi:ATP-binding cassette subfamily C (CFTR/MRP) protein 1